MPRKPYRKDRDNQRTAVYRWAGLLKNAYPHITRQLTLTEAKAYIQRVWNDYRPGEEMPQVEQFGKSYAWATRWAITLPEWAQTPATLLHEVAHSILPPGIRHNPIFATFYLELLSHYENIPRNEAMRFGQTQRPRQVRFAYESACPKKIRSNSDWQQWRKEELRIENQIEELARQLSAHREKEPER